MLNFIGGLLDNPGRAVGIDPETIDPRDRNAYRGMVLSALGNSMAGGTPFYQGLNSIREGMDAREQAEMERQQALAQQQMQQQLQAEMDAALNGQGAPGMGGAPGGQGGVAPQTLKAQALRRAAMRVAAVSPDTAKKYIEMAEAIDPRPEFFAPTAVTGPDGQPMLAQFGKHGHQRAIQGFGPAAPELPSEVRAIEHVLGSSIGGTGGAGLGALSDYRRAGAAQQNVQVGSGRVGTIPPGFELVEGPGGSLSMVPIPGGPVDRELADQARQRELGSEVTRTAAQTVFEDTARALEIVERSGNLAAGVGALTSVLPGTPARELAGHIDSIKGNIGIDSLLKIKASGAGLGAIPQSQLEMLASLLGNLDARQNPRVLAQNIRRVQEIYADIVRKEGGNPVEVARQRGFTSSVPAPVNPQNRPTLEEIFGR